MELYSLHASATEPFGAMANVGRKYSTVAVAVGDRRVGVATVGEAMLPSTVYTSTPTPLVAS